jgi:hypothetical protein
MTRRQEDQRREELQQLQASQTTDVNRGAANNNQLDAINTSDADSEELKKVEKEQLHQGQQSLNRLESLCAAAELSLKGLADRFNASQESDAELWKLLRAHQQQQQHRTSVVSSAAGAHPHRRASVFLPRRVSAVDLAHARSAAAQNHNLRGSIEIPINPQQQSQQQQKQQRSSVAYSIREGPISSIQEEQVWNSSNPGSDASNILPIKVTAPASTSTATAASTFQKNEFFSGIPDAVDILAHHFDLLSSLQSPSAATKTKENSIIVQETTPGATAGHGSEHSTHSSIPSGYKRSTMAGPAWMESRSPTLAKSKLLGSLVEDKIVVKEAQQETDTGRDIRHSAVVDTALSPRSERQQAQQQVQAAERYMRRLVGATVEPAPDIEDPFALDSSDEDERPVFDR